MADILAWMDVVGHVNGTIYTLRYINLQNQLTISGMVEPLTENELLSRLGSHIKQNQEGILRVLNGELIILFWNIGQVLQPAFANAGNQSQRKALAQLSKRLSLLYGPYFSSASLNSMIRLYLRFPDLQELIFVSSIIGWDQLSLLIKQENTTAFKFYLWLAVDRGLSASSLRKQIASKKFETYEQEKHLSQGKVFPGLNNTTLNKAYVTKLLKFGLTRQQSGISAVGQLPRSMAFRQLIAMNEIKQQIGSFDPANPGERLFAELSGLITRFKAGQNRELNALLNMLFWNVGKIINEHPLPAKEEKKLFRHLSANLVPTFGNNFKEKRLFEYSVFQKQVPNINDAASLAYLLPFGHITALLHVQPVQAKLYYATSATRNALQVSALKKLIAANGYAHQNKAVKQEITSKTYTVKKGTSTVNIKTDYIDIDDDLKTSLPANNIFNDKYFLNFLVSL